LNERKKRRLGSKAAQLKGIKFPLKKTKKNIVAKNAAPFGAPSF